MTSANADNWTAIMDAARDGGDSRVRVLLDLGTHPDSPDVYSGYTPLHYAIASQSLETVSQLLDAGADANHRNNSTGTTGLQSAVTTRQTDIVRSLTLHGAKYEASLVELARNESTTETVEILEHHSRRS